MNKLSVIRYNTFFFGDLLTDKISCLYNILLSLNYLTNFVYNLAIIVANYFISCNYCCFIL